MRIDRTAALLVVDVQNDFTPGGALGVPDGDAVVDPINRVMDSFDRVLASQDWHPAHHCSFASQNAGRAVGEVIEIGGVMQHLWPDHCIQNTGGALFAPGLATRRIERVFQKGTDVRFESYSTLFDMGRQSTGLAEYLRAESVSQVWLAGLALDYCVLYTARDARALGYDVALLRDACRSISVPDEHRTFRELSDLGVRLVSSDEVLAFATEREVRRIPPQLR